MQSTNIMRTLSGLAALGVGLLFLSPPSAAQTIAPDVMVNDVVGCKDWDTFKQLTQIAVQGDKEAFSKLASASVRSGKCATLKVGDVVYLQDVAMLSGASCVRPKGNTACYWVPIEASKSSK